MSSGDLKKQAVSLKGSETNLAALAKKTRDWVHAQMTPDLSLAVLRNASDIIKNRRGVCRDYAILYTSLARLEGVPTRYCVGIVSSEGKFFYHAWAESYLGTSRGWVAVDSMMAGDFVDATHVALERGDPESLFNISKTVGNIKIKVIEADVKQ